MEDNIAKEYWKEWFRMEQTQIMLKRIKEMSLDILQSSKNIESARRSDIVSMSIGIDMVANLVENLKEDS